MLNQFLSSPAHRKIFSSFKPKVVLDFFSALKGTQLLQFKSCVNKKNDIQYVVYKIPATSLNVRDLV